jgi:CheY-like chemotaxis protein
MNDKLAFVIEDDYDGSMVFAKALEANGLEPTQIMNGNLALEMLARGIPTLVVLDLHLPVVSGPDILKVIRSDSRLGDTLVVVVTADPRMADMIKNDADLVLLKPTTFSQVRDLVGRLMALRARNAQPKAAPATRTH